MDDFFTCKNCWNFHARGKAEHGTCRALLKPVKTTRSSPCSHPKHFTVSKIIVTYNIVDKRGGRIGGITDVNDAHNMCNWSNETHRRELMNYRKEQNNG